MEICWPDRTSSRPGWHLKFTISFQKMNYQHSSITFLSTHTVRYTTKFPVRFCRRPALRGVWIDSMPNRWIGGARGVVRTWLAKSLDLTHMDFYLRRHTKHMVHEIPSRLWGSTPGAHTRCCNVREQSKSSSYSFTFHPQTGRTVYPGRRWLFLTLVVNIL